LTTDEATCHFQPSIEIRHTFQNFRCHHWHQSFYGPQGPNYPYRFNFTHFDEASDLYGRLCDKNSNFPSFFSEKIPILSMNAIGESNQLASRSIHSVSTICVQNPDTPLHFTLLNIFWKIYFQFFFWFMYGITHFGIKINKFEDRPTMKCTFHHKQNSKMLFLTKINKTRTHIPFYQFHKFSLLVPPPKY